MIRLTVKGLVLGCVLSTGAASSDAVLDHLIPKNTWLGGVPTEERWAFERRVREAYGTLRAEGFIDDDGRVTIDDKPS